MKRKKHKNISILISTLLLAFVLTACGTTSTTNTSEYFEKDSVVFHESLDEETFSSSSSDVTYGTSDAILPEDESTDSRIPLSANSTMEVHFIDVGQGDSTLLKCDGYNMLIDAADSSQGTAIQLYLQKQNIDTLTTLVLTHPDADHIGGAPTVITKFSIETVYMSDFTKDNKTYDNLLQALSYKNLNWSKPNAGDSFMLGSAKVTFIAPNATYDTPNNASLGLLIEHGNNTFLFTGDAEEEAEQDIISNGINIKADVYHAGHHGSRSSSSENFLDAVSPSFSVISCGEDNSYGHPHAQTLNSFRSRNIQVFRTDEQGTIVATSDGNKITWNCAPSDSWIAGESTQNSQGTASKEVVSDNMTVQNNSSIPKELEDFSSIETGSYESPDVDSTETIEVHITKTGKKYHRSGCSSLKSSDITVSLQEAKDKGLEPCKSCNPPY